MRQRKAAGVKKKIALLLAMTVTATAAGGVYETNRKNNKLYAGVETETVYFAEGFGTGVDFSDDSWNINTAFRSGTPESITSNPVKYAQITENEHSGNNEKIIRLINGVRGADLNRADTDYRVGKALVKDKVSLKNSSEFSAKFTISMPDACVNTTQTGGTQFAREVGGDGIAFIITPTDSINGQAGAGMGYYGVQDSLVIEMDSYFNGAYCTFETSGTAYVNWAYDNQIYANTGLGYLQAVADDTRNKGIEYDWASNGPGYWTYLHNQGYEQLSPSQDRRFDHVGVMLDGVTRDHIGISYLNGLKPDMVTSGRYENISNPSASTPSSSKDCATRFADAGDINVIGEEVDNRLFTVWIEYDGANLYVRYANGNFTSAVRPEDAQIEIKNNPALASKFANRDVNIGFTSSIGSSKANHTVHSVAFVNEFMPDGIQTEYTQKYYVETPDAEEDFITVGSKKYVLKESNVVENVAHGSKAEITDKSSEDAYESYVLADYSANPLYPESVDIVRADGKTVLYQFYDLNNATQYRTEFYLQQLDGTYTLLEYTPWKDGTVGEGVTATIYEYTGFTKTTVNSGTNVSRESIDALDKDKNANVMKVYYNRNKTYKVEYYYENDNGTFDKDSESTPRNGVSGDDVTVTTDDKTPKKDGYQYDKDNADRVETDTLTPDGDTVLKVYFEKKSTKYKTEYYLQQSDGTYTKTEETDWISEKIGKNVTATIKTYDGYTKTTVNSGTNVSRESIAQLDEDENANIMKVYYNLNKTYKVEYYYENNNGTFDKDSESEPRDGVSGDDVTVTTDDKTPKKDGYQYDGDNADRVETDTLTPDGDTVLKVFFEKKPTEYKTEYYLQNDDGTYTKTEETDWLSEKTGKSVTATEKEFDGYGLFETEDTVDKISSLNEDRTENVMKLYYNRKTVYVVEYWYQNEKGDFDLDSKSDKRDSLVGSLVSVIDNDKLPVKDGYVYDDKNASAVIEEVANADGTTTLRVYFIYKEPIEPPTEPQPTPTEPEPTEPQPTQPEPTQPQPTQPEPTQPQPQPTQPQPTTKVNTPIKTGDTVNMVLMAILLISGATVAVVIAGKRKNRDQN